ncbi:MAG TPA: response regulator transcription factor [Deinococcales bacterium]|nr:response regulator transcription factor [Deinococcales bacterium]
MKIALVEDHALVRSGLRLILERAGHTISAEYGNAEDALGGLEGCGVDVVLLDLNLPGMGGLDALAALREKAKVIVLSMHEEPEYLWEVFHRGGNGYVLKRAVDQELLDALAAIGRGERYLHPSLAGVIAGHWASPRPSVLSSRERETIAQLAKGYSLSDIAALSGLSVKTVATYKARAMDKLGLESLPEVVRWAREHGLA